MNLITFLNSLLCFNIQFYCYGGGVLDDPDGGAFKEEVLIDLQWHTTIPF